MNVPEREQDFLERMVDRHRPGFYECSKLRVREEVLRCVGDFAQNLVSVSGI